MGGITKATENSEVMIGRRPLIKGDHRVSFDKGGN